MIQASGLTKAFGENRAVDAVSFQIERGEVVGLLGPNGAGKSTTMRMLTTYLEPDAGDARVLGHSVRSDPFEVRRHVGYLPEASPLYLEMTIPPYLKYMASVRGLRGRDRRQRVEEMIQVCGLADVLDREIGQLSRGYRQRVGLAATLVHDPQFLILDEPTTGLDPNQIVEIRRLIRRIAEHKTIVLSTHILPEVEATCDRVIIIAGGTVRADSTTAELTEAQEGVRSYVIGIKGDADLAESALKTGGFVQRVDRLGHAGDVTRFSVAASSQGGGPERLFQLAVARGLILVELTERKGSLEAIFADLTRSGAS